MIFDKFKKHVHHPAISPQKHHFFTKRLGPESCLRRRFPTIWPAPVTKWLMNNKNLRSCTEKNWDLISKNHGDFFTWFNTGWWLTYPSEKYESQWEGLSHILWKIKNVWNHPPEHDLTDLTHQISCSFMDLWALVHRGSVDSSTTLCVDYCPLVNIQKTIENGHL